jgi:hypothetical protein
MLPLIDVSVNTGVGWIAQITTNVNLFDKYYMKLRGSQTFLNSETGIILGIQKKYTQKRRIQFGMGYSEGRSDPFIPGGPDATDHIEYFNAVIGEVNYIHYFYSGLIKIGFNIGLNCTVDNRRAFPSFNTGIIAGIF